MGRSIHNKIDSTFTNKREKLQYPYIFISENTDAIAVVLQDLETGDLPIMFQYQDQLIKTVSVKRSPVVLSKILKLYPFTVFYSATDSVVVNSTEELLDESKLWI